MKNIRNSIIILLITLSMNLSGQFSDYINNLNGIVKQTINRESSYSGPITIIRDYNKNGLLKVESVYNGNDLNKDSLKSRNKFTYKLDDKKRISEILIVNQEKEKRKKIIKYKHSYYTVKTLWKENQKWKSYDDVKKFTNNHKEYKTKVILELGMFENSTKNIIIVEWPELIKPKPKDRIDILFQYLKSENSRKVKAVGFGKWKDHKFNGK